MQWMKAALAALPSVAASPLALVAYVVLIGAWAAIAFRVNRHRHLLRHLSHLPEKDRLKALELEMGGGVRLKAGLSPQQWLRSRMQLHLMLGFVVLCGTVVMLVALALAAGPQARPTVADGDISLRASTGAEVSHPAAVSTPPSPGLPVADQSPPSGGGPARSKRRRAHVALARLQAQAVGLGPTIHSKTGKRPSSMTIAYTSIREGDKLQIRAQLPYLDLLKQGGPVQGVTGPYLDWQPPQLSMKVANNTDQAIFVNEVQVKVKASRLDAQPIPIFRADTSRNLVIVNEGWGEIVAPRLSIGIAKDESCDQQQLPGETRTVIERSSFASSTAIPIVDLIPSGLRDAERVCVFGELAHGSPSARKSVAFLTRVWTETRVGAGMPSTGEYRVALRAGRAGYTEVLPVDQQVAPGETDHFVVTLSADRSAHFDLEFTLRGKGAAVKVSGEVSLDVLVPRSDANKLAQR
jgi:hypothetical protein